MLRAVPARDYTSDLRSLALMIVRLIEPGTSFRDPETLQAARPQEWDRNTLDFLDRASKHPVRVLLKVRTQGPLCET